MALGLTQPLAEMSTKKHLGENFTAICELTVGTCMSLNILDLHSLLQG
jgi:hypothetical protein